MPMYGTFSGNDLAAPVGSSIDPRVCVKKREGHPPVGTDGIVDRQRESSGTIMYSSLYFFLKSADRIGGAMMVVITDIITTMV